MVDMAIKAVRKVVIKHENHTEVDVKRYVRIEKIPGGELSDCVVMDGVMFNKDVTHPKMRRKIVNPRIMLLDCPLEYKKGTSTTNVEIMKEEDFNALLHQEEEYVENLCAQIISLKPDIVITEKGVSDLAQHYLVKANITAFRRLKKSDMNRVARATGATIVNRTDELQETDIGTGCGLFEIRKIGDEYFSFLEQCRDAKACTVLLRGGSKDVLNEIERNLQDAMQVVRNVVFDPRMLPGGGATEFAISTAIEKSVSEIDDVSKWAYAAVGGAMEVIPRTLAQNCGANVIRTMADLKAKHWAGIHTWGINGITGDPADMNTLNIWEPYVVKVQTFKTAVESSCLILRIDDVVSGSRRKK